MKFPRILYFIADAASSKSELADAARYGPNVGYRNATFVGDEALEPCDGVAGAIPAKYQAALDAGELKTGEDAITAHVERMRAMHEGDEDADADESEGDKTGGGADGDGGAGAPEADKGASGDATKAAEGAKGGKTAPAWKPNA